MLFLVEGQPTPCPWFPLCHFEAGQIKSLLPKLMKNMAETLIPKKKKKNVTHWGHVRIVCEGFFSETLAFGIPRKGELKGVGDGNPSCLSRSLLSQGHRQKKDKSLLFQGHHLNNTVSSICSKRPLKWPKIDVWVVLFFHSVRYSFLVLFLKPQDNSDNNNDNNVYGPWVQEIKKKYYYTSNCNCLDMFLGNVSRFTGIENI